MDKLIYEVRLLQKGRRRELHGVYESKQLAMIVADAQSRKMPIPGVVEVWECEGDRESLVRAFPGKV